MPNEALQVFKNKNIFHQNKIINYCGGGIAATLDAFVLYQLGFPHIFIYDRITITNLSHVFLNFMKN